MEEKRQIKIRRKLRARYSGWLLRDYWITKKENSPNIASTRKKCPKSGSVGTGKK